MKVCRHYMMETMLAGEIRLSCEHPACTGCIVRCAFPTEDTPVRLAVLKTVSGLGICVYPAVGEFPSAPVVVRRQVLTLMDTGKETADVHA